MDLLTEAEAKQVIDNFKTQLRVNSKQYGKSPLKEYCGAAVDVVQILTQAIADNGVRLVGSILERARQFISIDEPWFYYETNNQEILDQQDFEVSNFENAVSRLIEALLEELAEEEKRREEDERIKDQKPTREELKAQYRKTRRQLQQLIRRRKKKGIDVSDFGIKVPSIPKKITAGSIRRLAKEIAKVKNIK